MIFTPNRARFHKIDQNERREKYQESREIISYCKFEDPYDGEYQESTKINHRVIMKKPRINEEIEKRTYGYMLDYHPNSQAYCHPDSHSDYEIYGYIFPYEYISFREERSPSLNIAAFSKNNEIITDRGNGRLSDIPFEIDDEK